VTCQGLSWPVTGVVTKKIGIQNLRKVVDAIEYGIEPVAI